VVRAGFGQAVLALSSGAFFAPREKWIGAARKLRLPVVANPNYAEAGALVAFGASFPHMYGRAAEGPDPEGRKAGGDAGRAALAVRAHRQSENG
jgi:hypothetical protein